MTWLRSTPVVVVMLATTVGYLTSLARHLLGHDHGEYVTTGAEGGAPHPPGYPLYVLWLRLWSWLPLDAILRSSLASAVLGLVAALLLYMAARSFRTSPPAAALAAALFACSPRVWQIHTHAENLSLNSLLGAGILWAAAAPLAPAPRLGLLGLLAGCGASNHHLLAMMAPVWLWGVSRGCKRASWGWVLAGFGAGLLPYASPAMIARDPGGRWVWGELASIEDLVGYLLRLEYGSFRLTPQVDARQVGPVGQLLAQVKRVGADLLVVPALLGSGAVVAALREAAGDRRRWGRGAVAAAFLLSGPGVMLLNRTPPEALGGLLVGRLDAQAEMLLSLLAAWAVDGIVRRLGGIAWRARWVLPALALLGAPRSLEQAREAHRPTVQLYLSNLLATLPSGAVVIGGDDLHLFGLLYLQRIERQRPDVVHIAPTMLFRPWYAARIAHALGASPEGVTSRGIAMTRLVGSLMARGRPVLLLDADENYNEVLERFPSYPEGVVIRLLAPGSSAPPTAQIEALNDALFTRYVLEAQPPRPGSFGGRVYRDYARPWRFLAAEYEEQGRPAEAARAEARAQTFEPLWITSSPATCSAASCSLLNPGGAAATKRSSLLGSSLLVQRRPFLQASLAGLLLVGCSAAPSPRPPPPPPPRLHLDPLSDLLPAGGLDALVTIRWGEVFRALGPQLQLFLPPDGLNALGQYLGFDLRLIEELLVGAYGPTTVYLLRVPHDPIRVERLFRERLTGDQRRSSDGPGVLRMTGRIGSAPRGLATLLPDVLAFEVGPPGLLKAVVAFAQEKLKKARPALVVEPLRSAAEHLGDAPIRLFVPSPEAPWKGAHGLLERATAVAFSLRPSGENLALRAVLLGAWDDPPTEALRRLSLTAEDVAGSSMGRLTGLNEPAEPYRVDGDGEVLRLTGMLSAEKLARGLRDITRAPMDELFPGLRR